MSSTSPTSSETGVNLHPFLSLPGNSTRLSSFLSSLHSTSPPPSPEIKLYSDIIYSNYYSLGLSLSFHPLPKSYKLPKLVVAIDWSKLKLVGIDLYNHEASLQAPTKNPTTSSARPPAYEPFLSYPVLISVPSSSSSCTTTSSTSSTPTHFHLTPSSTGQDFVAILGEPDRKGGGSSTMGIWCEWTQLGLMVELASGGLQAWEKGKEAKWRCASLFERGVEAGKEAEV